MLRRDPKLEQLTYLDADLLLWSSPASLLAELGDGSTLLVPHGLPKAAAAEAGTYNVGWVTFRNDSSGLAALEWWRERCLDWCHDRFEPGRYGDQKYLDDFPSRFEGVRVTADPGVGLGPWNERRHSVSASPDGSVLVDGVPLVYFHHSALRVHASTRPARTLARLTSAFRLSGDLVWTVISDQPTALDVVWTPYLAALSEARDELAAVGAPASIGLNRLSARVALAQVAREKIAGSVIRLYRRMPRAVRYRVRRGLSPP